jgi:SAM-dependent methyltransferase
MSKAYYEDYWSHAGHAPPGYLTDQAQEALTSLVPTGAACLDIGCGDGGALGAFVQARGASYSGVDVATGAVERARAAGLNARVIEDASRLPFDEETFDVAFLQEVLEHLFEPQTAVQEAIRVLRPGGRLVCTVPNAAHWRQRLNAVVGKWDPGGDERSVTEPWRDPHVRFFNRDGLVGMLEQAGLRNVEVTSHGPSEAVFVPGLRNVVSSQPGPISRALMTSFPSVCGAGLRGVGTK